MSRGMIRVGIVGAGVLGSYHLQKCTDSERVTCAGVHDLLYDRAGSVAQRFGLPAFERIEDLIERIDAAIVATPCSTHFDVASVLMKAGKHVLVEKPLAQSVDEGERLCKIAHERDVVLHVGHSEVFNPAVRELAALRPRPQFAEIHRLAAFSPRGTDVSVILDLMVHDLHLLYRLCGEEPCYQATAAVGVPVVSEDIDIANARLRFPSGCVANVTASRISLRRMRKVRIFQKDNYFSCDLDAGIIEHCRLDRSGAGASVPIDRKERACSPGDALLEEQEAFFHSVLSGSPGGAVSGEEAVCVLKMTDAVCTAIRGEGTAECG